MTPNQMETRRTSKMKDTDVPRNARAVMQVTNLAETVYASPCAHV